MKEDLRLPDFQDANMFGGANPNGLYVPMTPDELEVLNMVIGNDEVELIIHGWGNIEHPRITFGDHRLAVQIHMDFSAPDEAMAVYFFDLELKLKNGFSLTKKRMPVSTNNQPVWIKSGSFLDMVWDIAIDHLNPEFIKMVRPEFRGLSSRRIDKDTKERTVCGNMKLDMNKKGFLNYMEKGVELVKNGDEKKAIEASKAAGLKVKITDNGFISEDVK